MSQVLAAHLYLAEFDHFARRQLHAPGYLRYVDDIYLFGDRRADLAKWRAAAGTWLGEERELTLKDPTAPIRSCRGTLHALGFRISRTVVRAATQSERGLARLVGGAGSPNMSATSRTEWSWAGGGPTPELVQARKVCPPFSWRRAEKA